jgi:hypothetical protein
VSVVNWIIYEKSRRKFGQYSTSDVTNESPAIKVSYLLSEIAELQLSDVLLSHNVFHETYKHF